MRLHYAHYLAMQRHVASLAPEEACGLVAGQGETSTAIFPITNVLHSPVRYRMAPEEQVRAFFAMEETGRYLLAIYHSHPQGPPHPSATDIQEATYPVVYLIWAPVGTTWVVRGFLLVPTVREIPIRLQ